MSNKVRCGVRAYAIDCFMFGFDFVYSGLNETFILKINMNLFKWVVEIGRINK